MKRLIANYVPTDPELESLKRKAYDAFNEYEDIQGESIFDEIKEKFDGKVFLIGVESAIDELNEAKSEYESKRSALLDEINDLNFKEVETEEDE